MAKRKEKPSEGKIEVKRRNPGKVNQNYFGDFKERVKEIHPLDEMFPNEMLPNEISAPSLSSDQSGRPHNIILPSTVENVDVLPSTELKLPSTNKQKNQSIAVKPSTSEKSGRPQIENVPSTNSDRHSKELARFDNRIKKSLIKEIKTFCLKADITQREFVEMSAVHFIEMWTAKLSRNVDGMPSHDDRLKMIMWKSKPTLINLYRAYNFENKWKFNDDEAAQKYNDIDLRIVELGIIETQFNSGFKKINSFGYYKTEIDNFINQKLGEPMLNFLVENYRSKWQRATGKIIDFSFLDIKNAVSN